MSTNLGHDVDGKPFTQKSERDKRIKQLYDSGKKSFEIAELIGISNCTVYAGLKSVGAEVRKKPWELVIDKVKNLYDSGYSVLNMSKTLGCERNTILLCMNKLVLKPRTGSEAMTLRFSKASPDYIKKITKAAHDAVRGKKRPEHELVKRALIHQTNSARFGKLEKTFLNGCLKRGLDAIHQLPVYTYNVDIGIGRVAVEIHNSSGDAFRVPRLKNRIVHLAYCGFRCFYINVHGIDTISDSVYDQLITFINEPCSLPTNIGQYRMIRGNGEFMFRTDFNLDHFTDIMPSKEFLGMTKPNNS